MFSKEVLPLPANINLPSNVDAEIAVLGGLIFDPHAYDRIADRLHPTIFSTEAHRTLCKAIISLREEGRSSEVINVVSRLSERGELKQAGGKMSIMRIFDLCVSTANIDQHMDLLVDKRSRRQAIALAQELRRSASSPEPIDIFLDKATQGLVALSMERGKQDVLESCLDIWLRAFPEIEERQNNPASVLVGASTGLYDLDQFLCGLQAGALITVAARPAMGKSALVMQIAEHVAKTKPVAVFSLEMSKFDIVYRAVSAASGVAVTKVRSGNMSADEMARVTASSEHISQNCWISENPCPTVAEINAIARSLKLRKKALGAVIVDYLQLMRTGARSRVEELSRITRSLKIMARTLKVPVLILSQLSRDVEKRTNKRPMLSDLRETGAIEQDSDQVVFLYRDEYYNPESTKRGLCELIVAKNRHGPVGTVNVLFEPHLTRFRNLAVKKAL